MACALVESRRRRAMYGLGHLHENSLSPDLDYAARRYRGAASAGNHDAVYGPVTTRGY